MVKLKTGQLNTWDFRPPNSSLVPLCPWCDQQVSVLLNTSWSPLFVLDAMRNPTFSQQRVTKIYMFHYRKGNDNAAFCIRRFDTILNVNRYM